jgi:hypothetical protein
VVKTAHLVLLPRLAGDNMMWRGQLLALREHEPALTDLHNLRRWLGEL